MAPCVRIFWTVLFSIALVQAEKPCSETTSETTAEHLEAYTQEDEEITDYTTVSPEDTGGADEDGLTKVGKEEEDELDSGNVTTASPSDTDDDSREGGDEEDRDEDELDSGNVTTASPSDTDDDSREGGDEEDHDEVESQEFNATERPIQEENLIMRSIIGMEKNRGFDRCAVKPYPCREDHSCLLVNGRVVCYTGECDEEQCSGRGACIQTPEGFRCVCPRGFEGNNCERTVEATPVCDPNPCKGDCECHLSCQHEFGYFCSSDGGFMGKNCTIPVPRVKCGQRSILIDISQGLYNEFDKGMRNTYFYMAPTSKSSSKCTANNVGGSFRISLPLPFSACDTRKERSGNEVVIRNTVYVDRKSKLFSMAIPILTFECKYERQYRVVTSLQPVIANPRLLKENGRFNPSVELCKVSTCPSACPERYSVAEGAVYTVGEMIYLRATALPQSGFSDFVTTVRKAFISCDRQASGSMSLSLVNEGCAADTGLPAAVNVGRNVCMALQTPRATGCTRVFIHLHLVICDRNRLEDATCGSGVAQTCGLRRRRRSVEVFEGDDIFTVVGPLLIIDGSEGEEITSIFPMAVLADNPVVYTNGRLSGTTKLGPNVTQKSGEPSKPDLIPRKTRLVLATVLPVGVLTAVIFMLLLACGLSPDVRGTVQNTLRRRQALSSDYSAEGEPISRDCLCSATDACKTPAMLPSGLVKLRGEEVQNTNVAVGGLWMKDPCRDESLAGKQTCLCSCRVRGDCACSHS